MKAEAAPMWPATVEEARLVQEALRPRLRTGPLAGPPRYLAACDAAYRGCLVTGAACLFSFPGLELLEEAVVRRKTDFPYVPGYLTFREGPAIFGALLRLGRSPGVMLFDGQGIAHPRGMGIASHIGVLLDTPSLGCAKSRLVGEHKEPGNKRGSFRLLRLPTSGGRKIPVGAVLRTRQGVSPVFVSPGHAIDIAGAVDIVLKTTRGFRLPEPLRHAHRLAEAEAGPRPAMP